MTTRFPFISFILFAICVIALYRGVKRTGLVVEGIRAVTIVSLLFGAAMLIEMELSITESGRCKYEAVFTDDRPEDVLDVYEIVGQRGNIYILEDKLY